MKILIQGGYVVDPAQQLDGFYDILLHDGLIERVEKAIDVSADLVYHAQGKLVTPGLVDMHVHLRDPGQTHKEDIISGTAAAAAGGVTSVCCMPNTAPTADTPQTVAEIVQRACYGSARVYPCAAITRGLGGKELCDYPALKAAGAVAVSDDGRPVEDAALFTAGVQAAKAAGLVSISHCEDLRIIDGGIVNAGSVADALGVKGMDRLSEDSMTAREISVAERTGVPVHIAHVSTRGAVDLLRRAKQQGIPVTAETAPHYFTLTHHALLRRDANWRMNPPLREEEDRLAIIEGLRDGTLDAIATDHAPHAAFEKADFLTAPNGIVGLESAFMAAYTHLVRTDLLPLTRLIALMSQNPANILGLPGGTLRPGSPADVAVFDIKRETVFSASRMRSKSRNTPFDGWKFFGPCALTVCAGRIVYMN